MSPEYLPHFFLLIAGVLLACVALHRLSHKRWLSALKVGGLGLAFIGTAVAAGTLASWKDSQTWRLPESMRPRPLLPADSTHQVHSSGEPETMNLVLGGVRIRVPASHDYLLSVANEVFLRVEHEGTGFLVSCGAASAPASVSASSSGPYSRNTERLGATISQNTVTFTSHGVRTLRPDAHTILVQEDGAEILRVYVPKADVVEVDGRVRFSTGTVRLQRGIAWPRNFIPPGPLDLTDRGTGRIDLEPSGTVRVVPP